MFAMTHRSWGRRVRALGALTAALVLIVGCGGSAPAASSPSQSAPAPAPSASGAAASPTNAGLDPAALEAAAKKEGTLTLYSSITPDTQTKLIQAFNQQYKDVKVNNLRLSTSQLAQRYATEAQNGQVAADVVTASDPLFFADANSKGWITSIADLPAASSYPSKFFRGSYATIYISPYVFGYNTDLVKPADVPQKMTDLLDPKWKGKLLLITPIGDTTMVAWWYLVSQQQGTDYLKQFSKQEFRLVASGVPGIQQVAAGAAAALVTTPVVNIVDQKNAGAHVEYVSLPPNSGQEGVMAVSKAAPHPNAARLFANFLMRPEGQKILAETAASPLPNVQGPYRLPSDFIPLDLSGAASRSKDVLGALGINQ